MNSANPKLNWTRLTIALGYVCAVLSFCAVIFAFASSNQRTFRPYEGAVGLMAVITWSGMLVCGISLLKRQKTVGRILIGLAILFFVLSMCMPAST